VYCPNSSIYVFESEVTNEVLDRVSAAEKDEFGVPQPWGSQNLNQVISKLVKRHKIVAFLLVFTLWFQKYLGFPFFNEVGPSFVSSTCD